jgi:hypothetical protein
MDRDELAAKKQSSTYANSAEVSESDAPVLPGITGRDDNLGADPGSVSALDIAQPIAAESRKAVTGRTTPEWEQMKRRTG